MPDELKPQSIDSPEFRELAEAWAETAIYPDPGHEPFAALIAHIDAWGARLVAGRSDESIIQFGASLLGHASETDALDADEAISWVRERWIAAPKLEDA